MEHEPEARADASRGSPGADGARLAALEPRLRLLLAHLAGRALRARVELDDLVQEVYLRLVAASLPPAQPGEARLWALARALARHCVVDAARAARAAKRDARVERLAWSAAGALGPRASALAAAGPGPATQAAANDEGRRLLAAFARLAPEHRRAIGLRQLEGLSAREAAARLGRSEAAVHSLYRRALAAWEEALGFRDESAPDPRLERP